MTNMYHEKQYLMHCAVHTLNNLFQEPWATASLMEDLAKELFDREAAMREESGMDRMWVNPYKSVVPQVGYYDINVLLEALKLKECHVSLHAVFNPKDPHAVARTFEALDLHSGGGVRGIVVNRVSKTLLGGLYTTHHFYAIIPVHKNAMSEQGTASTADAEGKEEVATGEEGGGGGAGPSAGAVTWYVIDSKAAAPEIIGTTAELALHLGMEARENQGHVFVVSGGDGETVEGSVGGDDGQVAG